MNGYKTSGDWTDITSIGRNEVVFEGRHKNYGAFYIRQRYPNALLLSLFSAVAFVGLCSFIPYLLKNPTQSIAPSDPQITVKTFDVVQPKPRVIPPVFKTPPHVQPPKSIVPTTAPPVITREHIDSNKPIASHQIDLPVLTGPVGNGSSTSNISPSPGADVPVVIKSDKPVMWVPEMPKFRNGKIEDYLANNLQYPAEDANIGLQGTVYASFVIEKDGSVSSVTLMRGIDNAPDLNREALRVLSSMPPWIPGKQDGHPVRVQFMVPIHFKVH